MTREYNSKARAQAKEDTRHAIVQALIAVIRDDGVHAFSMQNVADKAGVALRTVYRHFDSREALLEALADATQEQMKALGVRLPHTADEAVTLLQEQYLLFDEMKDTLRASVAASIATGHLPRQNVKMRTATQEQMKALGVPLPRSADEAVALLQDQYLLFDEMKDTLRASVAASIATGHLPRQNVKMRTATAQALAAEFPSLSSAELREASAVIGMIAGSRGWYVLSTEYGLSAKEGGRAAQSALRALVEDLKKRDRIAHRGERK